MRLQCELGNTLRMQGFPLVLEQRDHGSIEKSSDQGINYMFVYRIKFCTVIVEFIIWQL